MREGWINWEGKEVYLRLKSNRVYSGRIVAVDDSDKQIVFITILDKYSKRVTFVHSEIIEIKEEGQ